MDRSTWKNWERKVAEWFGGDSVNAKRIPVTGRQSGDVPDVETIKFAISGAFSDRVSSSIDFTSSTVHFLSCSRRLTIRLALSSGR